jgi:dimeric dUTPase (all-alpha-NTP-PPase superfamily)
MKELGNRNTTTKDSLKVMFELQKEFQLRVEDDIDEIPSIRPDKLPMQVTALIGELGEILEEHQGWKSWRENIPDVDEDNLRMEVIDAWKFLMNITLYLGYDADDVFEEFLSKDKINHERQDNGN